MKYQCEHSDTGICYECFQKTKDLCECGNNMHTKHDDRKFEVDNKEVCICCWVKSFEKGWLVDLHKRLIRFGGRIAEFCNRLPHPNF